MFSWSRVKENPTAGILLLVILAWVLWQLKALVLLLFAAMMLTLLLLPVVDWIERRRIPRFIAAPLVMLVLLALVVGLGVFIFPPITSQLHDLAKPAQQISNLAGPEITQRAVAWATSLSHQAGQIAINVTANVIGVVGLLVAVVFFSLYWLIDYPNVRRSLISDIGSDQKSSWRRFIAGQEETIIAWLRGQVILSLVVGAMAWVAYSLIGLPFVWLLAILAAALEIIPFIGPVVAAIPAILLALTISPAKALEALVAYAIIQIVESNLLAPTVMSRAVQLHPLLIFLSFLVADRLFGIVGIFFAIPTALTIREAVRSFG